MDTYTQNIQVKIIGSYDVIVAGGGVAGASAALAAAGSGCSVLLIEKSVYLGGLATLGLIALFEPLCDGRGRKIMGGMVDEMLSLAIKYGHDTIPEQWLPGNTVTDGTLRYKSRFSPSAFALALDEAVAGEGIKLMFDTVVCDVITEGDVCRGVIIENKSGRSAYMGKRIIDATGDLDVMTRAGAKYETGYNRMTYQTYYSTLDDMKKAVASGKIYEGIKRSKIDMGKKTPDTLSKYDGTDAEQVTKFVLDGQKLLLDQLKSASRHESYIVSLPAMAQFRMTRMLKGLYEMTEEDENVHFDDSVGCISDFTRPGVYEVPYRSLVCAELNNVITAGRTVSASGHAWNVTRIIPPACLTTGRRNGCRDVNTRRLRAERRFG